jgi:hypothetical protein
VARLVYVIRFFRIVPPVARLMRTAFLGAIIAAAVTTVVNPDRAAVALTPLLLLQLFASSSGFVVPARRGHYDLLLTCGYRRVIVAAIHWSMSVLPGVASWLVVAAVEAVATGGARMTLLASGTVVAVVLVSTLPWAVNVTLPRFVAAIGWLLVLAVTATVVPLPADMAWSPGGAGVQALVAAAVMLTLYPPLLVGTHIGGAAVVVTAPVLASAIAAMLGALRWIDRHDLPLEAAQ